MLKLEVGDIIVTNKGFDERNIDYLILNTSYLCTHIGHRFHDYDYELRVLDGPHKGDLYGYGISRKFLKNVTIKRRTKLTQIFYKDII